MHLSHPRSIQVGGQSNATGDCTWTVVNHRLAHAANPILGGANIVIDKHDELSGRLAQSAVAGVAFPWAIFADVAERDMVELRGPYDCGGLVRRTIVNDEQFRLKPIRHRGRSDGIQSLLQEGSAIACGDQNGDFHL
jgi:hypothetical protein